MQREQDDVDQPVGRLDLRALVALEDVLDDQRMEAEDTSNRLHPIRRGCTQVYTDTSFGLREHPRKRLEGRIAVEILDPPIEPARDADATRPVRPGRRPAGSDGVE